MHTIISALGATSTQLKCVPQQEMPKHLYRADGLMKTSFPGNKKSVKNVVRHTAVGYFPKACHCLQLPPQHFSHYSHHFSCQVRGCCAPVWLTSSLKSWCPGVSMFSCFPSTQWIHKSHHQAICCCCS